MKYIFTGKPDKIFPQLLTGKVYDLTVRKYGISKYIHGVAVQITSPIYCPYSSIEAFNANWREYYG